MPYTIIKKSGKYYVKNTHTGKIKNKKGMTHEKAKKYLGALEAAHKAGESESKMKGHK